VVCLEPSAPAGAIVELDARGIVESTHHADGIVEQHAMKRSEV
jgi:hypothetical protein